MKASCNARRNGAPILTGLCLFAVVPAQLFSFPQDPSTGNNTSKAKDRSHSHLTSAFNIGPRQQAKLLPGIGNAHFPITTRNPLVQKFFDQGLNQLYSFMYFEAERSFRQCVMLEPDNPMPFWGLAMNDQGKAAEFLKMAEARKANTGDRERRYIEALKIQVEGGNREDRSRNYRSALERIVLDYPDDIEAKLLLGQELYESADAGGGQRTAADALLKQVLAKNPLHPAANHFRIHLWDGPDAAAALDSCAAYPKAAPNIGHAQHMPGHLYAQLGMWEEAAYAMDAATRVERKYMFDTRQMPHDTWNFAHNQHYLIANLGYAGRLSEGERYSKELIDLPRDPQGNGNDDFGISGQGRMAMLRMWLRGEQWDRILEDEKAGWPNLPRGRAWRHFAKTIALIGKGDLAAAEVSLKEFEDSKPGGDTGRCSVAEAKGRLLSAQGKHDEAIEELKKAFQIETEKFNYNDPGPYPRPAGEALVQGYLAAGRLELAEKAARDSLDHDPNSGFGLALLAEALHKQGKTDQAKETAEHFKKVFKYADASLSPIAKLRSLGLLDRWSPKPYDPPRALDRLGPIEWSPFDMVDFTLPSVDGKNVRISDYKGKNLILVFFLGGSCDHCVQQLETFGKEKAEWDKLNTAVLAICPDKPEDLKVSFQDKEKFPFSFLSDRDHKAAKLYKAWDEFENLELHATVYITPEGKVWWYRSGSQPFTDMAFLKREIERVGKLK